MASLHALLALCVLSLVLLTTEAQKKKSKVVYAGRLNTAYYNGKCNAFSAIVNKHMTDAIKEDPGVAADILRLHFHDCWGCDASVLLDSVDNNKTLPERLAQPNLSLEGFEVIDEIKSELEKVCKGVVSCADILTTAARDGVVLAGGPSWDVPLGRKDGRISDIKDVQLPEPHDSVDTLIGEFAAKGLDLTDLVALSGAHTIGHGSCNLFKERLSGDPTITVSYAKYLKKLCRNQTTAMNDPVTPNRFDNQYYKNVQKLKGLFQSDEELNFDGRTKPLVDGFAGNSRRFSSQFGASMYKLITLPAFQSNVGGVRSVCSIAK